MRSLLRGKNEAEDAFLFFYFLVYLHSWCVPAQVFVLIGRGGHFIKCSCSLPFVRSSASHAAFPLQRLPSLLLLTCACVVSAYHLDRWRVLLSLASSLRLATSCLPLAQWGREWGGVKQRTTVLRTISWMWATLLDSGSRCRQFILGTVVVPILQRRCSCLRVCGSVFLPLPKWEAAVRFRAGGWDDFVSSGVRTDSRRPGFRSFWRCGAVDYRDVEWHASKAGLMSDQQRWRWCIRCPHLFFLPFFPFPDNCCPLSWTHAHLQHLWRVYSVTTR